MGKKKKDRAADSATRHEDAGAGQESAAAHGAGSLSELLVVAASERSQRAGGVRSPSALLSASDLQRSGLTAGDPVLLEAGDGRRTVAACESGGSGGGVALTAEVLLSLGVRSGDKVTLTRDFEAAEAHEVDVEVSQELQAAWPELMGGLQLDRYLRAVLDGALLLAGDCRTLSASGRAWQVRIVACRRPSLGSGADEPGESSCTPMLVTAATSLKVSAAVPAAETVGDVEAEEKTGDTPGAAPRGFARVGGLRSVLDELREAVQLPLERPDLYRRLGVGPPRGVLLYGPPGTGKTLLARSLAEEMHCPAELCASTDLIGSGIGESEERIKAAFDRCRRQAEVRGTGALLFIDEIDAVCPKRDDAGEAERRMVAAFLTQLDGINSTDGIVVLGATNRPDSIDPALRRAGRLERELEVGVPNTEERCQILAVHFAGLRHELSGEDQQELARRCHGYVGADLRAICTSAARIALRQGRDAIDLPSCMSAMRLVPPSALKELLVEVPEVGWHDIGGYEGTKEALREAVEWPIKYGWAFAAMRIDPPKGVLLYGPPGCSKTMMAKAVATETEMNFVSIKGPELFSKYVGDSEKAVRDVFRKARTAAPCVVFFDEVDAIGARRDEGSSGVAASVLAQLLAEMDGIGSAAASRHVVVLAATNRPHMLDPALLRPGRFDRLVHVPLPDEAAREQIFERQLARMRTGPGLHAAELARRTGSCTGAEVVMVCREAALLAIREALDVSTGQADTSCHPCAQPAHFDKAIATVRPRVDAATVQFYLDFEKRMKDA